MVQGSERRAGLGDRLLSELPERQSVYTSLEGTFLSVGLDDTSSWITEVQLGDSNWIGLAILSKVIRSLLAVIACQPHLCWVSYSYGAIMRLRVV